MSNTSAKVSLEAIAILQSLDEQPTGSKVIPTFSWDYVGEARLALEKSELIQHLTKTDAYQITPLGIYVLGLVNAKTKEVLNDTN